MTSTFIIWGSVVAAILVTACVLFWVWQMTREDDD